MKKLTNLNNSVRYVKGIGPKKANLLRKLNIETIEDLFYYFPKAYEDRREIKKLIDVENGEKVNLRVVVCGPYSTYKPRRGLSITKIPVKDDTGIAFLTWFNQNYVVNNLSIDEVLKINGRVKKTGGRIEVHNPIYVKENDNSNKIGKIVPIYPLTDKLSNNDMISFIGNAIEEYLNNEDDILPSHLIDKYELVSFKDAVSNIHFPVGRKQYLNAKKRLVFEELLMLQLGLFILKNKYSKKQKGICFKKSTMINDFIDNLPFKLTNSQLKVFNEIEADMESENQMTRLIQGDVGSGKTIIAILAMIKAYESGYQSVMMAPTEILATQHYESITNMLNKFGISCEILISSISAKKKRELIEDIKDGKIDIVVGTHALIQETVEFKNLGLTITDEQHRFGVRQRALLSSKGENPDILVMTATPIPRTLALMLYGDLDISIINELPPGRKSIKTYAVTNEMKKRIYNFVKKHVFEGRQAYIVCPLVEESDSVKLQSASELYEILKKEYFKDINLGLLHGKMKAKEKEDIMNKFKTGDINVLISTTVIEVGVNVPNANIMIVENAERFGLAQLHQLRGRVGRGNYQSYCILINESNSKVSKERMAVMERTSDGFIISEKDLEIRGPGQFFGTKQHGMPDLKIANLFTDISTLKEVQILASELLEQDPKLKLVENRKIRERLKKMFNSGLDLISFN